MVEENTQETQEETLADVHSNDILGDIVSEL